MQHLKELREKLIEQEKQLAKLEATQEWMLRVTYLCMEIAGVPEEKRNEWLAELKGDGSTH